MVLVSPWLMGMGTGQRRSVQTASHAARRALTTLQANVTAVPTLPMSNMHKKYNFSCVERQQWDANHAGFMADSEYLEAHGQQHANESARVRAPVEMQFGVFGQRLSCFTPPP